MAAKQGQQTNRQQCVGGNVQVEIDEGMDQQREQLTARFAAQMRSELLASRRPWESRPGNGPSP